MPFNSHNIIITPSGSPNITFFNSLILPINIPCDFRFPSSPLVQNDHSVDNYDENYNMDQQWLADLLLNPNQGYKTQYYYS
jgi:hypothetical protein